METSGISHTDLIEAAHKLLDKDCKTDDGIVTKDEISKFVSSSECNLVSSNISADEAIKELSDFFKSDNADSAVKSDSEDPMQEYTRLQAQITQYNELIGENYNPDNPETLGGSLGSKKSALEEKNKALEAQLQEKQKQYEAKKRDFEIGNDNLLEAQKKIEAMGETIEYDVKIRQERAVNEAIANYDPEKDGTDWDKYISKECEGAIDCPLNATLKAMVSNSQLDVARVKSIGNALSQLSNDIVDISDNIVANNKSINSILDMASMTATKRAEAQEALNNCLLSFVSEDEMALATDNNIDLKEKLEDGNPRYIFAKGKEDGAFHIYDMAQGASLARLYGCEGGSLRGDNIVPCGNGYINGFQYLEDGSENGEEVFWLTDCGMQSKKACYSTSSPLEFDLNGDGNKLNTTKTVQYDIDGDGKLDTINDSLDGILVFDKDGDGISGKDGSEAFGDNTDLDNKNGKDGYKNGFEALAALRDKAVKEGVIQDRGDGKLNADDLKALEENYGLKMKTNGYNSEAKSLADIGITEINISNSAVSDKQQFDEFGNEIQTQQGATFKINGQEQSYADVWHRKYEKDEAGKLFSISNNSNLVAQIRASITTNTANLLSNLNTNEQNLSYSSQMSAKKANKALSADFWSNTLAPDKLQEYRTKQAQEQKDESIKEQKEKENLQKQEEAKKQEELQKEAQLKEEKTEEKQ